MNIKQMPRVSEIKASVTVDELCNETRPPELAEFCAVVQSEMRGVKFADHSSRGVTVYRENDVFAMGNLYYADFRDTGDNEPMFIVESPYILNEKYAHGRAQQNMKMSKNLSTSVRTAKKFLRSHSPFFMARVVADDFSLSTSLCTC